MASPFPKSARLLKKAEFDQVFAHKCSAADRFIVVYLAENQLGCTRLGLVVSRRIGNAVARNRWKRSIREAFRMIRDQLPRGFDLVVIPRRANPPSPAELERSLQTLTRKLQERLGRKRIR